MSGPDDAASAHDDVVSGRAWERFCAELAACGRLIVEHSSDDLDRVEGFRYLSRLTRWGLSSFVEHGDARFPVIQTLPELVKVGADNPDAHYQGVRIDGSSFASSTTATEAGNRRSTP